MSRAATTVATLIILLATGTQVVAGQDRGNDSCALGAYFGDSALAPAANAMCFPKNAEGFGGMLVVFDVQIDSVGGNLFLLDPNIFRVNVLGKSGWVTPVCATLNPATDTTERRTVLLAGDFGFGGTNRPVAIKVVGDLRTLNGESLQGVISRRVSGTDEGPELLLAERFTPGDGLIDTSTGDDFAYCPAGETTSIVKLTCSSGPRTVPIEPPQY